MLATMYGLRTHVLTQWVKDPLMALCAAVAIPVITFDVLMVKVPGMQSLRHLQLAQRLLYEWLQRRLQATGSC